MEKGCMCDARILLGKMHLEQRRLLNPQLTEKHYLVPFIIYFKLIFDTK